MAEQSSQESTKQESTKQKSAKKKSTKATDRPKKPYPTFPLTPHASGKWQKKILGRIHYFGRWGRMVKGKMERLPGDGWEEALKFYKAQAADLHAGRTPPPPDAKDAVTIGSLSNRFLTAKLMKLDVDPAIDVA